MPDNIPDFAEMMGDPRIGHFPEPPPDQLRGFALELAIRSYGDKGVQWPDGIDMILRTAKRYSQYISTGE